MNIMVALIAMIFPVLVLGGMDTPETAFAQYLGVDLEKSVAIAKERDLEEAVICGLAGCYERWTLQQIIEQLEELRLPEERQKLQSIEERLVELRPKLRLLTDGAKSLTQSLEKQAENTLLDKRIELRLYDIMYENKFLIIGIAVAVLGIFFVWRVGGKSIEKNS